VSIADSAYKPHRVDNREHSDKIDDEIVAQIKRSRFILADFTKHRGGVYYEAGFAKGLGLDVIWTCREDDVDKLHFDIRQYNCILWNETDLDGFKNGITNRVEAVLGRGSYRPEE
jgi:nucleoside 2-deoxyribosyltransferase